MRLTDKFSEIRIYQSLRKNIFLAVGCMAFVIGGYLIMINPSTKWPTKIFGGLLCVIFFGGSGLFFAITSLYNRLRHIPLLIIYENKLDFYEQRKRSYHTIYFIDVKKFRLVSIYGTKMIAVDYKPIPLVHKFEESSDFKQRLMTVNFKETGAVENIPIHNLTMTGKEICNILNRLLSINQQ